jgi:hypothetical protein
VRVASDNEKSKEKEKPSVMKIIGFVSVVGLMVTGFLFVSTFPGMMFTPYTQEDSTGWADIKVSAIALNGSIIELNDRFQVDLLYAENGSLYQKGLQLSEFPIYTSKPLMFMINSTMNEYQYKYSMLFGNEDPSHPYVNEVFVKREVPKTYINLNAFIMNFTYDDYSNPEFLDLQVSVFELGKNDTSPIEFPFGTYSPQLMFNVSGIPLGYTWGASTIIPHYVFEQEKDRYPIAYLNGYNHIGLHLAFDVEVNLSILVHGSEISDFFVPIEAREVNLTTGINSEKLWVTNLPEIDINQQLSFVFETQDHFENIFLWSGHLDQYNSSFWYNHYQEIEV